MERGDVWLLFLLMLKITGRSDIKTLRTICMTMRHQQFYRGLLKERKKPSKQILKHQFQKAVINSVKSYREANDWLGHFINESCVVGETLSEKSGELYSKYRAYCLQNLEYTRSTTDFYAALNQAGYERKRTNKGILLWGYH